MEERDDLPVDEGMEETDEIPHFMENTKEFLAKYSHCALCGANLHITHTTDFIRNLTQETARCPECGVRARKLTHVLQ